MDKDRLKRLREGDETLFTSLVRDHHRALVALAAQLVGHSEAEEVVQNAWLKAHRSIAGFEGRSAVRTWLGRIVINEAKMALRRRGREKVMADLALGEETPDALADRFGDNGHWSAPPGKWHADTPEDLIMAEDLIRCLERLLAEMPVNQRILLELRDASGLSFAEICNELSISASNARVLLHRARVQLFRLVDHYQETGEC